MRINKFVIICCLVLSFVLPMGAARAALFDSFGLNDELELGREFEVMVKSSLPLVEDPEVKLYIQGLVDKIVAQLPPQPYKFSTSVVLNPAMNAFASPGGFVFVYTGLIQFLEHESELAGVLSHEIAHVTQRHIAQRIDRGKYISLASLLAAVAGAALGGDTGGGVVAAAAAAGQAAMLGYSRQDETEADQLGLQYLVKAGYAPKGLNGAFSAIQRQSWGMDSLIPTYLSTHPNMGERLGGLAGRIRTLPVDVQARKEDDARFNRVKTLLWGNFGDVGYALQLFQKKPNDPLAQMGLGMAYARKQEHDKAAKAFNKALTGSPKDALIQREAGIYYYDTGKYGESRMHLEKALALNPKDYMATFFLARLLDDAGEKAEAQKKYRDILRYVPEDAEIHSFLGRSLGRSGQQFEGYLHLAYAALYVNDKGRIESSVRQAKGNMRGVDQEKQLQTFIDAWEVRKKYWK